jgi:sugar phosphate isomerase/epimerase
MLKELPAAEGAAGQDLDYDKSAADGVIGADRLAFSTLAFPAHTFAEAVSLGRSYGYAGVELRLIDGELIDPAAMTASARPAVKRTAAAAGLPIVAVDSSIKLTGEDPARQLREFIELASDLESPLVRVFGGTLPADGPGRRAALAAAAAVLEQTVPIASRLGVSIGVETHDAFSASAVVAELLALVPSGWVGAVWDSHHPHRMGESAAQVQQNLGSRVLLAQVKDARRDASRDDGWQLVLLGAGEVPVPEILELLEAGGYPGWISVEWEKRWHPEIEEPEVALPQHQRQLATWLTPPSGG